MRFRQNLCLKSSDATNTVVLRTDQLHSDEHVDSNAELEVCQRVLRHIVDRLSLVQLHVRGLRFVPKTLNKSIIR